MGLIGSTDLSDLQGLAFAGDGMLYGWNFFFGLVTLDVGTGAASLIGCGGNVGIQALEFVADGTLS